MSRVGRRISIFVSPQDVLWSECGFTTACENRRARARSCAPELQSHRQSRSSSSQQRPEPLSLRGNCLIISGFPECPQVCATKTKGEREERERSEITFLLLWWLYECVRAMQWWSYCYYCNSLKHKNSFINYLIWSSLLLIQLSINFNIVFNFEIQFFNLKIKSTHSF